MNTGIAVMLCAGNLCIVSQLRGQGTIQITFDGPPTIPAGAAYAVTNYEEAGMLFVPIPHPPPGIPTFVRSGGGRVEFADDGTPYLIAGLGNSLMFSFTGGSLFSLVSVDLAEFSITETNTTVHFIGYHPDGSTAETDFATDGIIDGPGGLPDFQTFMFDKEWTGLSHVEIPSYGWSLDNLVVSVPEPATGALAFLGAVVIGFTSSWRRK